MTKAQRVLLVEDESIIAMDVQQRLERLGYQVVAQAASGKDAIYHATEKNPDLILMDVKIRGPIDGIETAAQIRTMCDIPVIYLTAFADENTIKRASLTEASGYLLKPFEDRELQSAIEIALYKHLMEKKLRVSEERYALAMQATNDGIWDWDLNTNEIFYSSRWRHMLGLNDTSCLSHPDDWLNRVHPEDREKLTAALDAHLAGLIPTLETEYRILHQDGAYRWMMCRGLALLNSQGKPYRFAGSQSDITTRKTLEEQLIHRALHDELTRLPNRALFMDRLQIELEQLRNRHDRKIAVMFLDIDHFKIVNDSLGHAKGDALLELFSQRLEQCLRPGDTVSRFGGDEFAILLSSFQADEDALKVADRIHNVLQSPFSIDGCEIFAYASMGIVFANESHQSPEDLLRDADIAMYYSKNSGRSRFQVFNPQMRDNTVTRLQQEVELRSALANHEFILHYQPVFALDGLKIIGFEALIRWQHPTRGLLFPGDFIKVAEQSSLIVPIGEWVLHTACKQVQTWVDACGKPLRIAVNLSASQLNHKNLLPMVKSALAESHLSPANLELELTESVALQNFDQSIQTLKTLREMGVSIAVDDFGKGYSSLDYIKNLPSNTLKIDRSFIQNLIHSGPESSSESAIVLAMITMAHQLHLKVVAEGVETECQLNILAEMNCDQIQGFYTGKPVPPQDISTLIS
jgi:diguanylate cyclase (GGDEF)-like protein/PAS domain S-box-containing protein